MKQFALTEKCIKMKEVYRKQTNKTEASQNKTKNQTKKPLEIVNPCEVKKDFGVVCKYEKLRIND